MKAVNSFWQVALNSAGLLPLATYPPDTFRVMTKHRSMLTILAATYMLLFVWPKHWCRSPATTEPRLPVTCIPSWTKPNVCPAIVCEVSPTEGTEHRDPFSAHLLPFRRKRVRGGEPQGACAMRNCCHVTCFRHVIRHEQTWSKLRCQLERLLAG